MDFSLLTNYFPLLAKGLWLTIQVCSGALLLGAFIGIILYLFSTINNAICHFIYRCYLNLFRGTPLLVQVYLVFYGGPFLDLTLSATQVGVFGMAFYVSAYFSEIYRAGFESVPNGQIEAARDLGLTKSQIFFRIQAPQIAGLVLPPLTNQSIILIKESAILSIIAVPEITTAAIKMAAESYSVIEPYLFLALAYWVITTSVSRLGLWAERKTTHYLSSH